MLHAFSRIFHCLGTKQLKQVINFIVNRIHEWASLNTDKDMRSDIILHRENTSKSTSGIYNC